MGKRLGLALLVGVSLAVPAGATCIPQRLFGSYDPAGSASSYIYLPPLCPGDVCAGSSVTPDFLGAFWAIGAGDPRAGFGSDHGTWAVSHWAPPPFPRVDGSWSGSAAIDGCVDAAGSDPSGLDPDQCMGFLLADSWALSPGSAPAGYALVISDRADASGNHFFWRAGSVPYRLQPVPVPRTSGDLNPAAIWDRVLVYPPVLPSEMQVLDAGCPAGLLAGYRVHRWNGPGGPTTARLDDGAPGGWEPAVGGTGPGGAPLPPSQSTTVILACDGPDDESVYLAHSLVWENGWETPYVSSPRWLICCPDRDADGVCAPAEAGPSDCDDLDPTIPGPEVCDGRDNDCDAAVDEGFDVDGDGLAACAGDCDDPFWRTTALDSEGPGDGLGFSVTGLGDLTGDGVHDYAAGARFATVSGAAAGHVRVYSGASGLAVGTLWGTLQDGARFGTVVADAGDLDGDGLHEVLVGADGEDVGGMADVGTLAAKRRSNVAVWALSNPEPAEGDRFGYAVARLGDLDGDAVPDLAVGVRGDDNARGADAGAVDVYAGRAAGAPPVRIGRVVDPAGAPGALFGYAVAALPDANADGRADLVVGAYGAERAVVLSGALVAAGAADPVLHALVPPAAVPGEEFGRSVAPAGDLDGDGVGDVLVGAPQGSRVLAFSGADGAWIRTFTDPAGAPGDLLGYRVASAGDLDGDGVPEVAAGPHGADHPGAADAGLLLVFSGATGGVIARVGLPAPAASDFFGRDAAALGDVDGDGVPDLVVGADGDDTTYLGSDRADTGSVWIVRGGAVVDPDADGTGNACDPDDDGDGAADAADCAPGLPGAFAVPAEVASLVPAGADGWSWSSAAPGAGTGTVHDLARGALGAWPVDGDPADACVTPGGTAGTSALDPASPAPGAGFRYLVRGRNACGEGSWGRSSAGAERAPGACP